GRSPPSPAAHRYAWQPWAWRLDLDPHRAGGALDDAHRLLDVRGVHVRELRRRDLPQLGLRDGADLLLGVLRGPLVNAGRAAQQVRGGGRLEHEVEGPVLEDRDLRRDNAGHRLRLLVVGLAELHDVDAVRA